jgi:hypothetical protein
MAPAALGVLCRPSQLLQFVARRDTGGYFRITVRRTVKRDARGWRSMDGLSLSAAQAEFARTSR